ncbi:TonB family protein [Endozoicomonas arenosclerae]|uniref:TonB family protein n=1 Tax=Endozoicomonas arenosclerae TaxID=1633495 RepID=UPI00078443B8|nr:TonB family protein [Endozoicomonas arenosclerae]
MKKLLIISLSVFISACSTSGSNVKSLTCHDDSQRIDNLKQAVIEARKQGKPAPLIGTWPAYPRAMIKQGKNGSVKYTYKVNPEGNVSDVTIIEQTDPAFGNEIVKSMSCWRFEPSKEGFTSKEFEFEFIVE